MDFKITISNGLKKGLNTLWMLTKIVIPVYFFVTFLKYTPVLDWISDFFAPAMKILGLPGEASIVLVLGNLINLYAGVGAIASLSLTKEQITILAVMLSFSHSLFMETAVAKKTGVNIIFVIFLRIILSILAGLLMSKIIL